MKKLFLLLIPCFLLCASLPLFAEETSESLERYTVELILFERPWSNDQEQWPEEPGMPDSGLAIASLTGPLPGEIAPPTRTPDRIEPVPVEQLQHSAIAYSLRKKGFRVLLHQGWRQVIPERNSPNWLSIESETLNGLLRLTKGRYLHIDTDLLLTPAPTTVETTLPQFRIRNHRRMRSGELHHIDHPKLGIIVQIDRYEAPEPAEPPISVEEAAAGSAGKDNATPTPAPPTH